jgi:hypothetical protein
VFEKSNAKVEFDIQLKKKSASKNEHCKKTFSAMCNGTPCNPNSQEAEARGCEIRPAWAT